MLALPRMNKLKNHKLLFMLFISVLLFAYLYLWPDIQRLSQLSQKKADLLQQTRQSELFINNPQPRLVLSDGHVSDDKDFAIKIVSLITRSGVALIEVSDQPGTETMFRQKLRAHVRGREENIKALVRALLEATQPYLISSFIMTARSNLDIDFVFEIDLLAASLAQPDHLAMRLMKTMNPVFCHADALTAVTPASAALKSLPVNTMHVAGFLSDEHGLAALVNVAGLGLISIQEGDIVGRDGMRVISVEKHLVRLKSADGKLWVIK